MNKLQFISFNEKIVVNKTQYDKQNFKTMQ